MNAIEGALGRDASMDEIMDILRQSRDDGMTAESALVALEALRAGVDQRTSDRILEIMDIASGFCAPQLRVSR